MINVKKRLRKLKKSTALYLDYRVDGKRIQEATDLHIYPGSDDATKQINKDNLIRFEILRLEKQRQLLDGIVTLPASRKKIDFFQYYKSYFLMFPAEEKRVNAVFKKLIEFHGGSVLPISHITENFLIRFKNHLEAVLTGETPHNYFKMLCKVINYATKEKLFAVNPASDITIRRINGTPKETLTIDELKLLMQCECANDSVKSAFLFSCFTGLRCCDVSNLKWKNVEKGILSIVQSKTGFSLNVEIHNNALNLLPSPGEPEQLVFDLPTTNNGCNKVLKGWLKKAGITKKITWHCARHTFATLLVLNGADILSVASVMGHRTIKYTQRYARVVDSMRRRALDKIPILN